MNDVAVEEIAAFRATRSVCGSEPTGLSRESTRERFSMTSVQTLAWVPRMWAAVSSERPGG
ncbi:hypothetical protein, partial [Streptomyces sp. NPDC096068]|uniref:hypothetical protein n=1 Tax=Streptomyces sp. NPDC096068 TaxID=3155424 RepID=UPI00331B5B5B